MLPAAVLVLCLSVPLLALQLCKLAWSAPGQAFLRQEIASANFVNFCLCSAWYTVTAALFQIFQNQGNAPYCGCSLAGDDGKQSLIVCACHKTLNQSMTWHVAAESLCISKYFIFREVQQRVLDGLLQEPAMAQHRELGWRLLGRARSLNSAQISML